MYVADMNRTLCQFFTTDIKVYWFYLIELNCKLGKHKVHISASEHKKFHTGNVERKKNGFSNNGVVFNWRKSRKRQRRKPTNVKTLREKIEKEFKSSSMKAIWGTVRKITGYVKVKYRIYAAHKENLICHQSKYGFNCHFGTLNFYREQQQPWREILSGKGRERLCPTISEAEVLSPFWNTNLNKSSAPDGVNGTVFKFCSLQLSRISAFLSDESLISHSLL